MRTRTKWIIGSCTIALVVTAAVFAVTKPLSPDGRYVAASPPAVTGDFYYELTGGKVYFVVYGNSGISKRDEAGAYFQTREGWFYTVPQLSNSIPLKIEVSWAGLTFTDGGSKSEFWRRRLISGKRPDWVTLYLPWNMQ